MANNNMVVRLDNENIVIVDEIADHATGENSGVFDETTDTLYPFGGGSGQYIPISSYKLSAWDEATQSEVEVTIQSFDFKMDKIYINDAINEGSLTLAAAVKGISNQNLSDIEGIEFKQGDTRLLPTDFSFFHYVDPDNIDIFSVFATVNTSMFTNLTEPIDIIIYVVLPA